MLCICVSKLKIAVLSQLTQTSDVYTPAGELCALSNEQALSRNITMI